jgi:hypothetical protein
MPEVPELAHQAEHQPPHVASPCRGEVPVPHRLLRDVYVSMVASDTDVPLLYEVPLLLVEQGA